MESGKWKVESGKWILNTGNWEIKNRKVGYYEMRDYVLRKRGKSLAEEEEEQKGRG